MKKVSIILLCFVATISLSLISCGGGGITGEKSPSDIELGMWKLVQKGNYEKAIDYWAENSADDAGKEQMKAMSKMLVEKMKESMDEKGGLKDVKIESEEIDDDGMTAKVNVLLTYGDGSTEEQSNKYKKVDGKWKIDSSMK
jgi:hypothetical protein